jgi:hypothetical protein
VVLLSGALLVCGTASDVDRDVLDALLAGGVGGRVRSLPTFDLQRIVA